MHPNLIRISLCVLLAGPLLAQNITTLDPLIVTADRGEIYPDSAGPALDAGDLDLYQAESLQDLSGIVPNLNFTTSDTRGYGDVITLRGQGNTLFFGPPAVALYVDDVPFADAFSYPSDLVEIEQLNVYRGPHGAMFGRNAPAGLIELATPGPGDAQRFGVAAEYGSYDSYGLRLSSRGPLGQSFGHSIQLYNKERDGFVNNVTLGRHTDDRSILGGIAALYWTPQPDVEVKLRLAAEHVDDGSQRLTALPSNPAFTGDRFTVASDLAGVTDIERYQASLHATRDFAWGRAKSITAWQSWDLDPSTVDLDLSPFPLATSTILQDQEYWTQEFRLEADEDADFWWRTGLFLSSKETGGDATRVFPVFIPMMPPISVTERTLFDIEEETVAVYATGRRQVTGRASVELGARLEYVDASLARTKTMAAPAAGSADSWYFSPTAGASYELDHAWTAFARTGLGIKPHGFSGFGDATTSAFGEERAWANEFGFNYDCPDQGLGFTLRGFWNEIDDYQVNTGVPGSTDFVVVNAEEVTARGVEAEARWQPVANLTLHANAGYTDTEFDSYTDPFSGARRDGNSVPYVPEFTAGGGFRYDFPGGFFVQSSLRATGETFYDDSNTAAFRQKEYYVWDAEVGYQRDDLRVGLFGRNLLDEEYYTFINDQVAAGSPGDPQLFGVRVDLAF
ncbi:MAG: TonB-dependent receptor [Akkermansiaceae bacterium]|nr:TonB-dependent receptor [Akkermansiaceae bacterium]NNM30637.1 TonB-dependent receptor [Akkermansiaceae bacterium]